MLKGFFEFFRRGNLLHQAFERSRKIIELFGAHLLKADEIGLPACDYLAAGLPPGCPDPARVVILITSPRASRAKAVSSSISACVSASAAKFLPVVIGLPRMRE